MKINDISHMFNYKKIIAALLTIIQTALLLYWCTYGFIMWLFFVSFIYDCEKLSNPDFFSGLFSTIKLSLFADIVYFPVLVSGIIILILLIKYLRNIKLTKKDYKIFVIALLVKILAFLYCIFFNNILEILK